MSRSVMVCKDKKEANQVLAMLTPEQRDAVKRMQAAQTTPVIIVVMNGKNGDMEIKGHAEKNEDRGILRLHNIVMDTKTARVWVGQKELVLTALEYRMLKLFLSAPGRVFSRREIFESCWEDQYMEDDCTINVHMSHIRQKIKKHDAVSSYIRTVRGIGFAME